MENSEVFKKQGEHWLIFSTVPTKEGLKVHVKAHPKIEEYFVAMSGGVTQDVFAFDRKWQPISPDSQLLVYSTPKGAKASTTYSFDHVGKSLAVGYTGEGAIFLANLSFLRLKGISEGEGIEFICRDVFSLDFRRELRRHVGAAFRSFIQDHLKTTKVSLIVSGFESQ